MTMRKPNLVTCAVLLALADGTLKVLGLRRAVSLARRLAGSPSEDAGPAGHAVVDVSEVAHQVATAAAFYPGRAQCLEQSLVLFLLLRRRGIGALLRIGVQPFPFVAHAWVEHRGRPVNEHEDFVTRLAPFPNIGG
jgi:hypothetical protein